LTEPTHPDKFLLLGKVLKEVYQAKLQWQFPDEPCTVELFIPDDPGNLTEYQISFWQNRNILAEVLPAALREMIFT
jgi:hypothetical protein